MKMEGMEDKTSIPHIQNQNKKAFLTNFLQAEEPVISQSNISFKKGLGSLLNKSGPY